MFESPGSRVGRNKWAGAPPATMPLITKLRLAANQAVATGVWTTISWDTLVRDDVGAFNNATPTFVTAPSQFSRVRIVVIAGWENSSGNARIISICQNGSDIRVDLRTAMAEANACIGTDYISCNPGDQFSLKVNQNNVASLNFSGTGFPGTGSFIEFSWYR